MDKYELMQNIHLKNELKYCLKVGYNYGYI